MNEGRTLSRVVYCLGSLALGLFLVLLLRKIHFFEIGDLVERAAEISLPWVGLLVVCTLFNFAITAYKWRMVTEAVSPGTGLAGKYFIYTALSLLVSQVLPPQISAVTVRSLALRFHERMHFVKGVASTLYDHMYDLIVMLSLLLPALLVLLQVIEPMSGLLLGVLVLAGAGVIMIAFGPRIVLVVMRTARRVPVLNRAFSKLPESGQRLQEAVLLQPRFAAKLFALSLIRCSNLVLRAYVVVLAVGLDIPFWSIVLALPVVQLAFIFSITPASIGIAEWGLVGVLCAFGIDSGEAVLYALFRRILVVGAVVVINGVVLLYVAARRIGQSAIEELSNPDAE